MELGYLKEAGEGKLKMWTLDPDTFRFLSSYASDELVSLVAFFSFFPSHYRDLPFFKGVFEVVFRFEKELSEGLCQ